MFCNVQVTSLPGRSKEQSLTLPVVFGVGVICAMPNRYSTMIAHSGGISQGNAVWHLLEFPAFLSLETIMVDLRQEER